MFKRLDKLHEASIRELTALRSAVPFKASVAHRRRMGVNGIDRLSKYNYSRWLTWKAKQRASFCEWFPKHITEKSLICWFVAYPKGDGFLDRIETWVGDRSPSYLTCYNVAGTGRIILDGVTVDVAEGEGVTFPLSTPHEIPETMRGSVWACAMTMDNLWGDEGWEGVAK